MRTEVRDSSSSIFIPPSSILRPPLMQGQIRPTCAKRSAAGRPNPTTLSPSERQSTIWNLESEIPCVAIASAKPRPVAGSGFSPDTQKIGKCPDLFQRSAIWNGTAGNWQLARVDSRPAPASILPCSASRESRT